MSKNNLLTGINELSCKVSEQLNKDGHPFTEEQVRLILDYTFGEIQKETDSGATVILGYLGNIKRVTQKAAKRRNPQTGEPIFTPERLKLSFYANKGVKYIEQLNPRS